MAKLCEFWGGPWDGRAEKLDNPPAAQHIRIPTQADLEDDITKLWIPSKAMVMCYVAGYHPLKPGQLAYIYRGTHEE